MQHFFCDYFWQIDEGYASKKRGGEMPERMKHICNFDSATISCYFLAKNRVLRHIFAFGY
jgi:hypothetical protein